jgi:hypothetical protein
VGAAPTIQIVNMYMHLVVAAGDSEGKVHLLDPRAAGGALNSLQLHKPGSKVNAVAVNPAGGASVVLTAGAWGLSVCDRGA